MSGLPKPPQSSTSSLTPSSTVTNLTLCGEESVCAAAFRESTNDAITIKYKFLVLRTRLSRSDCRYQLATLQESMGTGKRRSSANPASRLIKLVRQRSRVYL